MTCFAFHFLHLSFSRRFSCSPVFHVLISPCLFKPMFVSYSLSVCLVMPCVSYVTVPFPYGSLVTPVLLVFLMSLVFLMLLPMLPAFQLVCA